ncbi:alpha/beta fold hydrolase [Bacillaceae bacterium]
MKQSLYYEKIGESGPTLVFIPGIAGTSRYWKNFVSDLAQSNQLILIDPLGFGNSPKPFALYTVDRHIKELHHVLAPYQPFVLVGHSMGAILAVAFAARYPEMVDRLVLMSLPYFGKKESVYKYFRQKNRWFLTNIFLASLICIIGRRVFRLLLPKVFSKWPREVLEDFTKHTWRSFTSSLWEVIYRYDIIQDIERFPSNLRVLCLHGEKDETAPLEGIKRLAKDRLNWEIQVLPGGDHHPLLGNPEWCKQFLRNASLL